MFLFRKTLRLLTKAALYLVRNIKLPFGLFAATSAADAKLKRKPLCSSSPEKVRILWQ